MPYIDRLWALYEIASKRRDRVAMIFLSQRITREIETSRPRHVCPPRSAFGPRHTMIALPA